MSAATATGRMTVRADRVLIGDVTVLDGREYTIKGAYDVEGRGKVTGISMVLEDNASGAHRSANYAGNVTLVVYR